MNGGSEAKAVMKIHVGKRKLKRDPRPLRYMKLSVHRTYLRVHKACTWLAYGTTLSERTNSKELLVNYCTPDDNPTDAVTKYYQAEHMIHELGYL